jgi:hypothetical protein
MQAMFEIPSDGVLNLALLAAYLRSLPQDYRHFEMSDYFGTFGSHNDDPVQCGTVACAVGHGPAAGLPRLRDQNGEKESWPVYEERVFGEGLYECLFSGEWSDIDDSARGAAARILALIQEPDRTDLDTSRVDNESPEDIVKSYARWVP